MDTNITNLIIHLFFKDNKIYSNQIESYNNFINFKLEKIFKNFGKIILQKSDDINNSEKIKFSSIKELEANAKDKIELRYISHEIKNNSKKIQTPENCINCDKTYNVEIKGLFKLIVNNEEKKEIKLKICKLPIMVGSEICSSNLYKENKNLNEKEILIKKECKTYLKGFFIINGSQKTIVSQLVNAYNKVIVSFNNKKISATIDSYNENFERNSPSRIILTIKNSYVKSTNGIVNKFKKKIIDITLPKTKECNFTIPIIFSALGIVNRTQMKYLILGGETENNKLIDIVELIINDTKDNVYEDENVTFSRKNAINYIINRSSFDITSRGIKNKFKFTKEYILKDIFPHLGTIAKTKNEFKYACLKRAYFLGYMVKRLLMCTLGIKKYDDKDDLENKSVDTVENLLSSIFFTFYKNSINLLKNFFSKIKPENFKLNTLDELIINNFQNKIFTNNLNHCFSTGDFNCSKNNSLNKKGIGQTIVNKNIISRISHLTKINCSITRQTKDPKIRQIDGTKIGSICPIETPEGENCGLVQNLATFVKITKTVSQEKINSTFEIIKKKNKDYGYVGFLFFKNENENENENIFMNENESDNYNSESDSEFENENENNDVKLEKKINDFLYEEYNNNDINIEYNEVTIEYYKKIIDVFQNYYKLFINGNWVGFIKNKDKCIQLFRKLKNDEEHYMSVSFNRNNEIHIQNTRGRIVRPLYVLKENKHKINEYTIKSIMKYLMIKNDKKVIYLFNKIFVNEQLTFSNKNKIFENYEKINWNNLITKNIIEYLDISEQKNVLIKLFSTNNLNKNDNQLFYNNAEIHESVILGITANLIPLSNHNQPARNIYQTNLLKQSILWDYSSYTKINTLGRCIIEPQKQLSSTIYSKELKIDSENPGCINVICAISTDGFNVEDSTILSEGFVQRGAFKEIKFKSFKSSEEIDTKKKNDLKSDFFFNSLKKKYNIKKETINNEINNDNIKINSNENDEGNNYNNVLKKEFGIPSKNLIGFKEEKNYKNLDKDGLTSPGKKCKRNTAIIGQISKNKEGKYFDKSIFKDNNEDSVTDKVIIFEKNGIKTTKINTHNIRNTEVGVKFHSLNGQKSVCGKLIKHEDLPFTLEGITPDVIINPHCIPSRMTLALLKEGLYNKVKCIYGIDDEYEMIGTSFEPFNTSYYQNLLFESGYNPSCEECVIDGETGEMKKNKITFLIISYYKNVNQVRDKIHVRTKGRINEITRQTTDGRSNDGGLRIGTMERDAIISYGIPFFIKEKYMTCSDGYKITVCKNCGAYGIPYDNKFKCKCGINNDDMIKTVSIPYSYKLVLQELYASGIDIKFILQN